MRTNTAHHHAYCFTTGTEVRIIRIFNTYGPRMALDDGRVVSNFVAQALTGVQPPLWPGIG